MRALTLPVIALTMLLPARPVVSSALLLEVRIFKGPAEVTDHTRITVHRAGDRTTPLVQASGREGPLELQVPEGIYDVQAIEERQGQVVSIHWAHRLVVMPYPDEKGRHLEVLNFRTGFGALQVRTNDGELPEVSLHRRAGGDRIAATPITGAGYTLFVVPAGVYDVMVRRGVRSARYTDVEVPGDRTRLWLVPEPQNLSEAQTRRPESRRTTMTTSAMTSRMWISPPTTSRANPSSQSTTRMTTIVHSMRTSPGRTQSLLSRFAQLQARYPS